MHHVTTSFRVGKGIGIVYGSTLALFEPMNSALAESLWDLVGNGAGIDELLEDLSSTGLRSLGSFAMAQFEDTQTRVVVRGTASACIAGVSGRREISAKGVRTWVEEVIDGVVEVELSLAGTTGEPLPFRVGQGLIPADVLQHGVGAAPEFQGVELDWVDDFRADEALIARRPVAEPATPPPGTATADSDPGRTITSAVLGSFSDEAAMNAEVPAVPPLIVQAPALDLSTNEEAAYEYDEIFGRTISRSVSAAAVHAVEDESASLVPEAGSGPAVEWPTGASPAPKDSSVAVGGVIQGIPTASTVPLGDHDGHTMTRAQIAALRAAQSGVHAPPPASTPMGGPTVQALLCPNQHPNPPQFAVCRVCNTALGSVPVQVARPVLGSLRFSDGTRVALDRPVLIGRNPKVEGGFAGEIPQLVTLDVGHGLSRTHASIRLEGWQVLLEDLNSANGTIVRLPGREPRRLHPGEPVLLAVGSDVDLGGEISCVFESS